MKKGILSIMDTKKNAVVTIFLIVIIATITKGAAIASTYSANQDIKDDFYKSVNYEPGKDLLSFTIPETIHKGYRFYLHVSGRMFMGDKSTGISFHAFDKESLNYTWKSGKTYTYPLASDNLDFISMDFGLQHKNSKEFLYTYTIYISPDGTKTISKVTD